MRLFADDNYHFQFLRTLGSRSGAQSLLGYANEASAALNVAIVTGTPWIAGPAPITEGDLFASLSAMRSGKFNEVDVA